MLKPLVIFSLLLLSVSSFGQDRLSYLKNIELLLEEEHYEDLLAQKSELEKHTLETDTLSASIYSVFGECHLILNDLSEAEFYYVKSLDLLKLLNQNVTGHYSNVLYNLTDVYLASGKFDNAFSSAKELVSLDKELYGSKSPLYLETLFIYTDILIETGQYIQALKALKQVDGKFKDDFLNALILTKKGDILTALGNYEKSVDFLESSLDTYSQLNDTLSFTLAQASLGLNYIGQGKYPQAENVLLQSRKAFEGLPETEFYVDNVNSNIALAQMALGRSNQAIAIYEELLHKDSAYFGVVHPKYLTSLINVGMAYNDIDDHNKAESYMLKALTIVTDIYGEKSKNEASIYTNLGIIKREKGDFDAALNAFDSAEELFINSTGKETIEFSTVKFNKGVTLLLMDSDLAEKELISSLKLRKSLVGIGHPKYAESTNYLGLYYWKKSDLKNARKYFEETFINFFDQIL